MNEQDKTRCHLGGRLRAIIKNLILINHKDGSQEYASDEGHAELLLWIKYSEDIHREIASSADIGGRLARLNLLLGDSVNQKYSLEDWKSVADRILKISTSFHKSTLKALKEIDEIVDRVQPKNLGLVKSTAVKPKDPSIGGV